MTIQCYASQLDHLRRMREEPKENLHLFLLAELAVCFTFCEIAEGDLRSNQRDDAKQAVAKAEDGYSTVQQYLPTVRHKEHRAALQSILEKLRVRLDPLESRVDLETKSNPG
jgi:hypothetical protein